MVRQNLRYMTVHSQDYSSNSSLQSECAEEETSFASSTTVNRRWVRRVWLVHIIISIGVMSLGIAHNKTSKYIPISPQKAGEDCERAFLNVLATSPQEDGAIICCTADSSIASVCPSEMNFLPLANRLARWPDAWLLPLFPLFLRIIYNICRGALSSRFRGVDFFQTTTNNWVSFTTSLRRMAYYIILLNFRGWVLYVGLNAIEDMLVRPVDTTICWYHDWLRSDQAQCFGRVFDFSDHIVLYYAQILPVSLFEFLHSLECPYWNQVQSLPSASTWKRLCTTAAATGVPVVLCFGMVYLYGITCLGVYKTAVYFHTGWEVVIGFFVSQLVHSPLCVLQCADRLEPMREFLFATSSGITKYKSLH